MVRATRVMASRMLTSSYYSTRTRELTFNNTTAKEHCHINTRLTAQKQDIDSDDRDDTDEDAARRMERMERKERMGRITGSAP